MLGTHFGTRLIAEAGRTGPTVNPFGVDLTHKTERSFTMAIQSSIEWTGSTWNPVTGCTKLSAGCQNCYAERMARRLQAMGQSNYAKGFTVACHEHVLDLPLRWKQPRTIFVNSMSDLFHDAVPLDFIQEVFKVMTRANHHVFQVLTKRAERLAQLSPILKGIILPKIWTRG